MAHKRNVDVVVGTAGHIDHGKSALVRALTGVDPDRLAEERERGITIELGFAQLELADGVQVGMVDVPGHERFVRQMIAGATGIDVALLVIAADDGVMPQTVEHVAVLQTLGVERGVIALTKADLVDDEWVEFMTCDVRDKLAGTPFAAAPLVAVSAKTGAGLDDLRAALLTVCKGAVRTKAGLGARLPVDRVFTVKGAGTVVTGTLWSGEVRVGDTVELLPQGASARVRGVQTHGVAVEAAREGNRVALNLAGVDTDEVRPGDFVCAPGTCIVTDRFDARFTYLDTAKSGKPLETGARLHVAHGTREVLGRVLFCDGVARLAAGESCVAQVRLEEPLAVCSGDRFIVRTYSPVSVAGGGAVLLAHSRRRTTVPADEQALLDAVQAGDVAAAAEADVRLRALPISAAEVARFLDAPAVRAAEDLDAAVAAKRLVKLGEGDAARYIAPTALSRITGALSRTLVNFHANNPGEAGMPKRALADTVAPRADSAVFELLLAHAVVTKNAVVAGGVVGHPSVAGAAAAAVEDAGRRLAALLEEGGASPLLLPDAVAELGMDAALARKAVNVAEQAGLVFRAGGDLFFGAQAVEGFKRALADHLKAGGGGTAAELKDVLGTTRKYAIPLLERFDAQGFTVRDGEVRRLRVQD